MSSGRTLSAAKLVAMWAARAVGTVLILFAVYLWLATPSPDCNPLRLFGCGLLDLGIGGIVGSALRWLLICIIAAPGMMLWQWKPSSGNGVAKADGTS